MNVFARGSVASGRRPPRKGRAAMMCMDLDGFKEINDTYWPFPPAPGRDEEVRRRMSFAPRAPS